jgi:type VI secretion system (T6SS) phospholipase Tle1-like effector
VRWARHALALDDERTTFHPVLWTEVGESKPLVPATIDDERLVQVWFVGMHANVGGGYPDDAVSFVPLSWLVDEAIKHGLVLKSEPRADPDSMKWINSSQDKDGRLYDSRSGLGSYYRYGPRKVSDLSNDPSVGVHVPLPKIHESVFDRIDSGWLSLNPGEYFASRRPTRDMAIRYTGHDAPQIVAAFQALPSLGAVEARFVGSGADR